MEDGQTCMSNSELEEYFLTRVMILMVYETKIDYEDIENPLKTTF